MDGSGNVVVTGYSYNGTNLAYYTAKYAVTNGALLREKRYNGPGNGDDRAAAVAVDGSGNVVVTGYSSGSGSGSDYYTAKYATVNGALLWEKRYNGPANDDDTAAAVAVDGSGNVVVTGNSYNTNVANPDYYTAKYAAADGALLWEKRYNDPANGSDFMFLSSHSLALGPNGVVAITGSSDGVFNSFTNSDYASVVYWEKLPPVLIAADGVGGYFVRGSGIAGSMYQLQRATNLIGPWASNATIAADSLGLIDFHDTNAPSGYAYYRTVQP